MTGTLASELAALIGRQALLETTSERLRVAVLVREAKVAYGRPRVLVTPMAGDTVYGVWVDAHRLLEMPTPTLPPTPAPDPPRPEPKTGPT